MQARAEKLNKLNAHESRLLRELNSATGYFTSLNAQQVAVIKTIKNLLEQKKLTAIQAILTDYQPLAEEKNFEDNLYFTLLQKVQTYLREYAKYFLKPLNAFYEYEKQLGVQVVLPVEQGRDPFLIETKAEGFCQGYSKVWSEMMMRANESIKSAEDKPKTRVFGMPYPIEDKYTCKPVRLNGYYSAQKGLNHLAHISRGIQMQQGFFGLANLMISSPAIKTKMNEHFLSVATLAEESLSIADHHVGKVCFIELLTEKSVDGHEIAFFKNGKNKYSFFDANCGWRIFTATQFKQWLPEYFAVVGYYLLFSRLNYGIYALSEELIDIGVTEPPRLPKKSDHKILSLVSMIIKSFFIPLQYLITKLQSSSLAPVQASLAQEYDEVLQRQAARAKSKPRPISKIKKVTQDDFNLQKNKPTPPISYNDDFLLAQKVKNCSLTYDAALSFFESKKEAKHSSNVELNISTSQLSI